VLGARRHGQRLHPPLLVQLQTPDEIRGRVSAVSAVFIGASNELGEFESGVTAAWWGTVPAVVIGGGATMVVAWLWMRWFPELSKLDRFPPPEHAAGSGTTGAPASVPDQSTAAAEARAGQAAKS
jgi:hypothetical protein